MLQGIKKDQLCLGFLPNIGLDQNARALDDPLSSLYGLKVLIFRLGGALIPLKFRDWDQIKKELLATAKMA
jgi:hypothetical protein